MRCPVLVPHADRFSHLEYRLMGAMYERDAERITELVPQAEYREIPARHVIHLFGPKQFVRTVQEFGASVDAEKRKASRARPKGILGRQ